VRKSIHKRFDELLDGEVHIAYRPLLFTSQSVRAEVRQPFVDFVFGIVEYRFTLRRPISYVVSGHNVIVVSRFVGWRQEELAKDAEM